MKVLCVWGTRPEAIKFAPVVRALKREGFDVATCATGQHRELAICAAASVGLRPQHDLDLMRPGQSLQALTAAIVRELPPVIDAERPDIVLVQGDTTTAFAAALAAFYRRLPVGHVEAGLRTFDRYRPFPEELNRALVDRLASVWFAPTETAKRNLLREGIDQDVYVTGNTVVDALEALRPRLAPPAEPAARRLFNEGPVLLVTAHRRENLGRPMEAICAALLDLLHVRPDLSILFPAHPNLAVRRTVERRLRHPRVVLARPLPYERFLWCVREAELVLTDSGGVQEEAPSLGTPVVVLRGVTERPEAISAGSAVLAGVGRTAIVETALTLLDDPRTLARMGRVRNPFGDGKAGRRIAAALRHYFAMGPRPKEFLS